MAAFSQNIEFIENKGQWDARVKFMGKVDAGAFFVEKDGFKVLQHDTKDYAQLTEMIHGHLADLEGYSSANSKGKPTGLTLKSHAYKVNFLGGNPNPEVVADKALPTYNNYFIGNDPSKWASNCKIYQGITVKNIYPNIDIRYYSGQGNVKYDLIVHPGGNPADIAMRYDGADGLEIKDKELRVKTSVGELKELNPYTYQYNSTGRVTIGAKYTVKGNIVKFDIKNYDPNTTLVIDPDLVFCSFSGSRDDNWGFTATYGPNGEMYAGGIVFGSNYPVSTGAVQTTFIGATPPDNFGSIDIGIIKLSPDGKQRLYGTFLGGNGNELPHSLIVTPNDELIVAGRTKSPNYPTKGVGLYGKGGGFDIIVTKLSPNGDNIIGSVRIGGTDDDGANIHSYNAFGSLARNYGDDSRTEVNLDAAGNIYLASCTRSTGAVDSTRFPRVNAVQNLPGGAQDGVILKLDPSVNNLLFSTYFGGIGDDASYVLALHPTNGNIYVAGGTASTSSTVSEQIPGPKAGTIGATPFGTIDGFVTILSPDGSSIIKTTYIGAPAAVDIDQVYGIKFDLNGFPYIMGQTTGSWRVVNAAWSQPNGRQFIAKLQPDLSAYVYSTMFGKGQTAPDISPVAFLVDRCENVYISGWGGRIIANFPNAGVIGLPVTPDAMKSNADPGTSGMGEDFYFFVLKKDAVSQLYGSFFGQNNAPLGDHVDGGTSRFDANGVIYQAICASCGTNGPFPTGPGTVWANTKPNADQCNLAMVKIAFNFAGARGDVRPSINGVPRDSTGCVPLTIDFMDTIQEAPRYEWNFGDGTPSKFTDSPLVTHTYFNVGVYKVMMIAIDSSKCFPRDTSYVTVKVGDNMAMPSFRAVKLSPPCDVYRYRFDNTSVAPPGIPFGAKTFTWDFGDGSPKVTTGAAPVLHTYANQGAYVVKLTLADTAYCNSPETYVDTVRVASNVQAVFTTPAVGCAPYEAAFQNESVGGAHWTWDFGDGSTSNDREPKHLYTSPGIYTVKLTAVDSNTCNIIDDTTFTIRIYTRPIAQFTFGPQPPQVNSPISFTNLSSTDAIRFKWVFGDGDSLMTNSRAVLQHDFNLTNTYNTCLTAYNQEGCEAQQCQLVATLAEAAVDVPNAFTPQSGDVNSKVYVRGFNIAKMKFSIYARWGEKVFETANKSIGWDGRYKGQLLPMDVYAFTLEVEFTDGKKYQKKGDITLIR